MLHLGIFLKLSQAPEKIKGRKVYGSLVNRQCYKRINLLSGE